MADVWRLYQTFAKEFDRGRGRGLMERTYLNDMCSRLRPGAEILDLGCGAGEPIARFLIERGYELTGVDAAPAMLAMCAQRFPAGKWIEADMRSLDLDHRYDAIIAWDSFFHLNPDEQRDMFPIFQKHITPNGVLVFTSGPKASEAIGNLYGHDLYHASLDPDEYRQLLARSGFRVLLYREEDPDCGRHTVWLAEWVNRKVVNPSAR
jgi:trans-aconitate methyltransferase